MVSLIEPTGIELRSPLQQTAAENLRRLASDNEYAKSLIRKVSPGVRFLTYRGEEYLLRSHVSNVWGYEQRGRSMYFLRAQDSFFALGMKTLAGSEVEHVKFPVEPVSHKLRLTSSRFSKALERVGYVEIYPPSAFCFTAFFCETPKTLQLQAELGISLPIAPSTAFRFAGL